MRALAKGVVGFTALSLAPMIHAAMVGGTGTVTFMRTYLDFGQGDFIFRLSNPVPGCSSGFWMSPSQPGFKTSVALIMQARATGEAISIVVDDAQIWIGSSGQFCKADSVGTP